MNKRQDPLELFDIGVIGRAQGLRGEVRVHLLDIAPADVERLKTDMLVLIAPQGAAPREIRLTGFRFQKGVWIVELEGIEDREAAESLRGGHLAVYRKDLWEPEEDEFFEVDLVGLQAIDDATDEAIGVVIGLEGMEPNALLKVRHTSGKVFLVPMAEPLVKDVDLDGEKIYLDLPEGLIDLND